MRIVHSVLHFIDRTAALFMAVALVGLGLLYAEQASTRASQDSLHQATRRSCDRVNVERARNNRNALAQYSSDKAILHYDLTFRTLVVASLKHQTNSAPRTKQQKQATKLFISKLSTEIDSERSSIGDLEWVVLTDCFAATDHPATYRPPKPSRFINAMPSADALTASR